MHGDSEFMYSQKVADLSKPLGKVTCPVEGADRVGGKGNCLGADPEKLEIMLIVVLKNPLQAVQIGENGFNQPLFPSRMLT
jgi:hypothetical protein